MEPLQIHRDQKINTDLSAEPARWAQWHFVWGTGWISLLCKRHSQPYSLPRSITVSQSRLSRRIFFSASMVTLFVHLRLCLLFCCLLTLLIQHLFLYLSPQFPELWYDCPLSESFYRFLLSLIQLPTLFLTTFYSLNKFTGMIVISMQIPSFTLLINEEVTTLHVYRHKVRQQKQQQQQPAPHFIWLLLSFVSLIINNLQGLGRAKETSRQGRKTESTRTISCDYFRCACPLLCGHQ